MIDPRIPLMGQQQQDTFGNLAQGIQMGQGLRQLISGRQLGKMQQLAPEDRQAFADKSMFSRELNAGIKADQAAQVAQAMALQKHNADIGKTQSEAFKNNTQGQGYGLDNSGKIGSAVQKAISHASITGDKNAALTGLRLGFGSGEIPPDVYENAVNQLSTLNNPQDIKNFAMGLIDAKYSHQSIDNAADNLTSRANNEATVGASVHATNTAAGTAAAKLKQDGQQFNQNFEYTAQQDEIKNGQGELKEYGGKGYIVYKDGSYRPAIGADGTQISTSKSETPEQKMVRIDNALGSADGAKAAARASQDAAALINHPGLYWGTGSTNLMGLAPGTDAKEFHVKLENLKAQVFLPTVKALQGMGALSNAEGEKISAAVANLDPKIGPEAMKEQLTVLAKQMSEAAKSASKRTQNFASRGGTIPLTTKPPVTPPIAEQRSQAYKGATTSLSSVKQAAQQAGISTEEMVSILKSQGAIIK